MSFRIIDSLKKLAVECTSASTASSVTGNKIHEVLDYMTANFTDATSPTITLETPYIVRYEGTTPIYRVWGEQDITSFTDGSYDKEITYDASEKRIIACGCSASVNFGTSPQTWEITSNEGNNLVVNAVVSGGGGNSPTIAYKVKDRQSTPTATTGILYYWYEYKAV